MKVAKISEMLVHQFVKRYICTSIVKVPNPSMKGKSLLASMAPSTVTFLVLETTIESTTQKLEEKCTKDFGSNHVCCRTYL